MADSVVTSLAPPVVSGGAQSLRRERVLMAGLIVAAFLIIAGGVAAYENSTHLQEDRERVAHTHEVIASLENVLLLTTNAQTAERGYVLTGNTSYLQPYQSASQAIPAILDKLGRLIADNPSQVQRLQTLLPLVKARFELAEFIVKVRRREGFETSRAIIVSDRGDLIYDAISHVIAEMENAENQLLTSRLAKSKQSSRFSVATAAFGSLISLGIVGALAYFIRRAFAEERKTAQALAEIDQAKSVFFANISHEFRTPLTLMLGPLETLSAAHLGDAHQQQVDLAYRNALRLLKLVNSLLDFASIEAGRVQVSYTPTDLATLTAEMASMFSSAVERTGLSYLVDCPPLPERVYVDADLWEKIVLNLVSNAFKFTFRGSIAVRLRWQNGQAVLTVTDTGTGIPAAELPRLFERFYRVPNARSRTEEGTGIGLALVQELMKLHGGTIGVNSTPDVGSTFTVTVPGGTAHLPAERIGLQRVPASTPVETRAYVEVALHGLSDGAAAAFPSASAPPNGSSLRPRILWVDDNADMRAYVRGLLLPYWDVEVASDGKQALDSALRDPPDLVLSDIMLPELDGLGLLQALRADPCTCTTPFILLSARAGEEARVAGLSAGADDYLVKPFGARELIARIGTHLGIARLRHEAVEMAQHDALTGLPNRKLSYEFAERLLDGARRSHSQVAVMFIDMDRFKPINDLHGHEVGDSVLQEVARRLNASVRGEDTAGRLGGDEFLVVLSHIHGATDAAHAAQHLVASLSQPYCVGDLVLHTSPSIGISLFPEDGLDIETLLGHADVAMYHAKEGEGGAFQLYTSAMNVRVAQVLCIENQMRNGMKQGEFQLLYQPIVDVSRRAVIGVEALMRWPATGIGPSNFIAVAESNGMIDALGEWSLTEACRQARQWLENGLPALQLSVNVSPLQFRLPTLHARVEAALKEYDIPAASLQLELTETALLKDPDKAAAIMRHLKQLGVKIALDDFGKGYSSLSRLGRLPLDTIKVDQEFIMKLASSDPTNEAITDAIIAISRTLGLRVVAEGVESAEVQALLCDRDCPQMQGFHLCPPLPAAEFEDWYRRRLAA